MIHFENIMIQVHGRTLLDHIDLCISDGDKVVVRGPSGCGKSSLLKSAVGALKLSKGTMKISGTELSASTVADIRSRIAFIGQEPILGAETVREALLLPFTFKAHRDAWPDEARILQLLKRLHLTADLLNKSCKHISGGEKQRIAVARAMLLDKSIFLADEVTSALDPESKAAVMTELFRPETTLLSVSHDPDWINACNRIIEISNGELREVTA